MFHDPDFTPFEPATGRLAPLVNFVRNYLETFPAATYRDGYSIVPGHWPFADTVYLTDPDLIEEVLVARPELFGRDLAAIQAFSNILSKRGLFLSEGADWRWQRRAVSPAFRHEKLLGLVPVFSECAKVQAAEWRHGNGGEPVDVAKAMTRTTFEVIQRAILGDDVTIDREKFLAALTGAFEALSWQTLIATAGLPKFVPHPGFFRMRAASRYLHRETAKIIGARRGIPSDPRGLLALLSEARDPETGRTLDDEELVANLFTFIAAGHETTAVALAWTLWLLAKDQVSQNRVRDEVESIAPGRAIGSDEVEKLAFTRQVILESMRLFPPAPAISRQAREDAMLGPHAVSKKSQIIIPIWSLHRNERLWDDPAGFEPERFAPEQVKARPRFAYLPFGGGPRICIGMSFAMLEATTIIATLVRDFKLRTVAGFHPELAPNVSLRPRHGLPLLIEPL
jgi:cytochrome P450